MHVCGLLFDFLLFVQIFYYLTEHYDIFASSELH